MAHKPRPLTILVSVRGQRARRVCVSTRVVAACNSAAPSAPGFGEGVAVPHIATYITRAEWMELASGAPKETERRRMPTLFGWLASAGSDARKADALATVPAVPRALFRLLWWPAYQRRMRKLYGAAAPGIVPAQRGS